MHPAFPARPDPEHPAGAHSPGFWLLRGMVASLAVPGLVLVVTFIGFGGLLHDLGFPLVAGVLSTVTIWALPAQVILIGGLAAGTSLPALALAVCLSGVRLMPMVVSLGPLLRNRRSTVWSELFVAHFVAVTMWVEGLRQLPKVPAEARPVYAVGLGAGLISLSSIGTVVGYYLTGLLPGPLSIALLLLTPVSFTILLVRNAATPTDWLAIVLGGALAPIAAQAPGGLDLFWSGVGGGTIAFIVGRFVERRR